MILLPYLKPHHIRSERSTSRRLNSDKGVIKVILINLLKREVERKPERPLEHCTGCIIIYLGLAHDDRM